MAEPTITTRPRPAAEELPSGRPPRSRLGLLILMGAITAMILTGLVLIAIGDDEPAREFIGAGETQRLLGGIPQDGAELGSDDAPVTVDLFNDMQCTDCRQWHLSVVPALVEDRVRPGDLRLVYHHVTQSEREANVAFFAATAAGLQEHQWQYLHLFFLNQANAGGQVDDEFLDAVAAGVIEFDASSWREEIDSDEVREIVEADARLAAELELPLGPATIVTGAEGTETLTEAPSLAEIEAAIERVSG